MSHFSKMITLIFVSRFQGAPYRSTCLLQPTSSSLVNTTEWVSEHSEALTLLHQSCLLCVVEAIGEILREQMLRQKNEPMWDLGF